MSPALPIRIEGVSLRADGRAVLDGLSASIGSAGITAVIGPNGAGKSVTLRVIDGLLVPDSGRVRFGSRPGAEIRRAFVFQKPGLIRSSVADNVALALAGARLGRAEMRDRVAEALRRVGLLSRARDAARKLSGGEQQRLALARAAVTEPDLLLLDEPTAHLDPAATEEIEALVLDLSRGGAKVILVSHNLGQVGRLAEDVLVLAAGRAVEHGPAARILAQPRSPEARAYLAGELPWMSCAAAS
ncbi:ATP-binding cassette domain-containing protein [Enterovirga sp.]|uniref:ATP-binding cassette domain-containing protein n=1 Tax=Enterovirga sp. TaxID=2026350 RepID=UPI00262603A1|nr:ATP-binding cassette domain-containing protein [Enterovirga sp.]MDB5592151.1 transporter ATP-binding protein [Enterovirga sp.]